MTHGDPVIGFIILVIALVLYFLPAINAAGRQHRQSAPIFLTNLFFGWTLLGWIIALIWSVSANVGPVQPVLTAAQVQALITQNTTK